MKAQGNLSFLTGVSLLFAFILYVDAQHTTYSYSLLNNGTCQPVQSGDCIPCVYSTGYPVFYYKLLNSYGSIEGYSYSDSACTFEYSYRGIYEERCSENSAYSYLNCEFFVQVSSISVLTLTLSSTDPIDASFIGDNNPVSSQLSTKKIVAEGPNLAGVRIESSGKHFYVEKQVTSTQYSTNIGVFTLGQSYTHNPFTFTVSSTILTFPFELPNQVSTVFFSPFFTAKVTNDNTYPTFTRYGGEIGIQNAQSDDEFNFEGLILSNPIYSIVNMTFYPAYEEYEPGYLVFQVEKSSTPYFTIECYEERSENSNNIYDCSMGSLSGLLSGSFLSFSFSLDEFGEQQPKVKRPDEMSFSLF